MAGGSWNQPVRPDACPRSERHALARRQLRSAVATLAYGLRLLVRAIVLFLK